MNHIILIGFMGCGKTSVGSRLAKDMGLPFVDMDDLIREEAGMEITEIFHRYGERYFRRLETQTLRICCQQTVSLSAAQAADIARSRIYDSLHVEAPECEILSRTESVEESEEGVLMTMNLTLLENIARQVPYTSEMEPEIPAEFG